MKIFVIFTVLISHQTVASSPIRCPCLSLEQTLLETSAVYDKQADCLQYESQGVTYCFPLDYGLNSCKAHDQDLEPFCNSDGFPGNPDWCTNEWCWVDESNCNVDSYGSSFFPGLGLRYSYSACGGDNTFSTWVGDGVPQSFTSLVSLVERYVVGVKQTLERGVDAIRLFSSDGKNAQAECQPYDSCFCSDECEHQDCWGLDANFLDVNLVLNENQALANSRQDVNFVKCASQTIRSSYLQVGGREYNDPDRVAYQYYGDQATGAMVQWPETQFCPSNFDARFRPWYAAAASGPKDIVIVVDTSGSMSGTRMKMAIQAIQQVAKTLTWVDYVNVITFNTNVDKQFARTLIAANEDVVSDIVDWASGLSARGGTDFDAPLAQAYKLLDSAKNSADRSTCAQAILFMTDGVATLDEEKFQGLRETYPDVVIFSYALTSDAEVDVLKKLSCDTGGLFHPVNSVRHLPSIMAKYYEYYIKMQDTCKLAWIRYTDAGTGSELVAGCTPIFDYGESSTEEAAFVGVTCQDLNTIVALEQLKSCTSGGFGDFIEQIRREAGTCPSNTLLGARGKITNECVLQSIRQQIDDSSVCSIASNETLVCDSVTHPTNSSCDALNPDRFEAILLEGCANEIDLKCAYSLTVGSRVAIAVGMLFVFAVILAFLCKGKIKRSCNCKQSKKEALNEPAPDHTTSASNSDSANIPSTTQPSETTEEIPLATAVRVEVTQV